MRTQRSNTMQAGSAVWRDLGLTDDEYRKIVDELGREPNSTELAMYSVMWSEHCSYKSSRTYLATLPHESELVVSGPGENAGAIRVDDANIVFKIESHNHPSFIEPAQGAATGVGGIVRDVLAMGARPIALLDSLRFGNLADARTRYLVEGVISGISAYGNCLGVPTVGGEIRFEECYAGNPLVNVLCIGVSTGELVTSRANGVSDALILLGSATGRDGIGGVSVLASAPLGEDASQRRPSVQVGDPFTEKLLIETCLELVERGLVAALQDLGGAGLACAVSEPPARGGTGSRVDVARVTRREPDMEPLEVMTSETQERMLAIVEQSQVKAVLEVARRWGVVADVIGEVTATGRVEVLDEERVVADVPAASLAGGPVYDRRVIRAKWQDSVSNNGANSARPPRDFGKAFFAVISSVNCASARWVWEQYDYQVQLRTVLGPGGDAAVVRVPGTKRRLAVSTDGNSRFCYLDPYLGTQLALAEAARNVAVCGAEPLAVTNCLNFGNPEDGHVMWQFAESVRGLADACRAMSLPVTGGNVSFYNESNQVGSGAEAGAEAGAGNSGSRSIYPTPVVGVIGAIPADTQTPGPRFIQAGDVVVLLGATMSELDGSEYAKVVHACVAGRPPALNLIVEARLHRVLFKSIGAGLLNTAHDCSEGGLAVALAEATLGGLGATVAIEGNLAPHEWAFSESASRVIAGVAPGNLESLVQIARAGQVPISILGEVGGDELVIKGVFRAAVAEISDAHESALAGSIAGAPSDQ